MSTQFLLDTDDIKELANLMILMIETQESRKQLCRDLGINPHEVSFIRDTSDDTFCTELIECLNRYGYKEDLCKLCCQKLFPILNKSVYNHRISILENIIDKLNCNCNQYKRNSPIPTVPNSDESKPESWFTKISNVNKKLLAGGAIILIVLAGYPAYEYLKQPPQELDGVCADLWVTGAVRSVMGRVPIGTGDRGECNKLLYNNGHWNNYDELLGAVNKSVNSYTEGVCRDPWITRAVSQVMKRPPKGKGELGECDMYYYGGGSWNDYNQLLVHVRAALGK